MKKENLNYSIESLKTIYNHVTQFAAGENSRMFSVWIDGLEIVPVTRHVDRLLDFMLLDFNYCQTLTVFVFDAHGTISTSYEMKLPGHFQFESEQTETAIRLQLLEGENKYLKREQKKYERSKLYEKPQNMKVIDAGNMLVLFVDKETVSQSMREQLESLQSTLQMTQQSVRIFERFINQKGKE